MTVCIPTRGRGAWIVPTLRSLRRLDHDSFEVVVADQSSDGGCAEAFREEVGRDPRFSYVRSATSGRSANCNQGLARARGDLLVFTDDDCEVPRDWLSAMERSFALHPQAAMICAGIVPAPHDAGASFTTYYAPRTARLHRSAWLAHRVGAIGGANLAVRVSALRRVGGFDEVLGVGAPLRSAEDVDLAYRLLRQGCGVLELPEPAVTHHELAPMGAAARALLRGYAFGQGAMCMKHLRAGDVRVLPLLAVWPLRPLRWGNILAARGPTGLRRTLGFFRGMAASLDFAVDRRRRLYTRRAPAGGGRGASRATARSPSRPG